MERDNWLGIELRHFAALAAVAEERSFRGAAERLGYAQSAISRQIAQLEQLTGSRLIERARGPRPVYLTDSGETLLAHAYDIVATIEAARIELRIRRETGEADVSVAVCAGASTRILAATLAAYSRRRPGAQVNAVESVGDAALFDLLRDGRADLAVCRLPAEAGPFAACELIRVPWVLVVPAGAEIAAGPAVPTLEQIASLPLIGFETRRLEPWTDPRLRAGIERQIVFRCEAPATAQALAGAGVGAAFITRLDVQDGDPKTAVVEIGDLLEPACYGAVWLRHRTLSAQVTAFRDLLRHVCSTMERNQTRAGRFERADDPPTVDIGDASG